MTTNPKTYITLTISVVLLIAIATYFILSSDQPKKEYCINLVFPGDKGPFSGDSMSKMRKYTTYNLTNDVDKNKITLAQIRTDLNALKSAKDTTNGIDILLDDKTTYQDIISTVDICMEKQPRAFAIYKNHLFTFYVNYDTTHFHDTKGLMRGL